jgi:demethylphylloquinol methyltransferase
MIDKNVTTKWNYNGAAPFYELLASLYSMGLMNRTKLSQITEVSRNDKVLFAGVGPGKDAVLAGKKGAAITCIDLASDMLDLCKQKFLREGLAAEFICGDVMRHNRLAHYDVTIANFFLNIFPESIMLEVLHHLSSLLKPGGKLLIADFAPIQGNPLARCFQTLNYRIANIFYWLLRMAPLHPIYDYPTYFERANLSLLSVTNFGFFSCALYDKTIGLKK